jgi:hypothetical protein
MESNEGQEPRGQLQQQDASTKGDVQRFIQAEELTVLPLVFDKNPYFAKDVRKVGIALQDCSMCCWPTEFADAASLRMDAEALHLDFPRTDLGHCCSLITVTKTVKLERVEQVSFGTWQPWLSTRSLEVRASKGNQVCLGNHFHTTRFPDIQAPFLRDPEQVKQAIEVAVKLRKQQPPTVADMTREVPKSSNSDTKDSLESLALLIKRAHLTSTEGEVLMTYVLSEAGGTEPLLNLSQAASMVEKNMLTPEAFAGVKARVLSSCGMQK